MHYHRYLSFLLVLITVTVTGATHANEFAGSESCKACHAEIYKQYRLTGHPYKLQAIDNAAPTYPTNTSPGVPNPPADHSWENISYVIGGFAWKARFMDKDGFVMTGKDRQYNLANARHGKPAHWTAYDGDDPGQKPYTCGGCHTTGWEASGPNGPHQNNMPGIYGTWAEAGVTCEACHGPAAAHVANPKATKLSTEENCGSCHSRGDVTAIDASGGLIRHHEQYEGLLASPHSAFSCGSCHSPHKSTVYGTGGFKGEEETCKTCHADVEIKIASKADMACASCHMPFAAKSAVSSKVDYKDGSVPVGDLRTHIQRVTLNPDWNMFSDDGQLVRVDDKGKAYLTLDYVCMSCHTDQTIEWARAHAERVH